MRAADHAYFDAPFLALAHRGGAHYPPNLGRENTAHAFGEAVALGYRYLETDVHATADGELLAFHDDRLDRVTNATGKIGDLPYARVREALVHGIDPIPRLADLLEAFPATRFNLDAKSAAAVEPLARVVAEHEAYDRVCVGSFGVRRLHRLRRLLGPRVASSASPAGVAWYRFAPWLAWALRSPAAALQIPLSYRLAGRRVQVLTPTLLRAAHRTGKQVHIWTIDDATQMDSLIDAGVDGIVTDRPDRLKTVLVRRGRWAGSEAA
ncbi:MAG: glycerophosphodiester phosphodiesterase family protein [Actinomycetes bacterium]